MEESFAKELHKQVGVAESRWESATCAALMSPEAFHRLEALSEVIKSTMKKLSQEVEFDSKYVEKLTHNAFFRNLLRDRRICELDWIGSCIDWYAVICDDEMIFICNMVSSALIFKMCKPCSMPGGRWWYRSPGSCDAHA